MGNEQKRLVSLEFIGGLVTGEGCFCLSIANAAKRATINPVFQLFMVDHESVEILYESMRHFNLPVYFYTRKKESQTQRTQYGVHASGVKRVLRVASELEPHLFGDKRDAALVAQEFCEYRLALGPRAAYGPKDIEYVERMRKINGNSKVNRVSLERLTRILRDYTPGPSANEGEDIVRSHVRA